MAKELDLYIKSGGFPKPLERLGKGVDAPVVGNSDAACTVSSQSVVSPTGSGWSSSGVLGVLFVAQFLVNVVFLIVCFKLHDKVARMEETVIGLRGGSTSGNSEL